MKDVKDEGLAVQFLKETSPGFYIYPDMEDISFPVLRQEVVVLQEPESKTVQRKFGFMFNTDIKTAIMSVLNK